MMAALFLIFLIAAWAAFSGRRKTAIAIGLINLGLCLLMLLHHATDKLKILL